MSVQIIACSAASQRALIKSAIARREAIELRYEGDGSGTRLVHPYVVGTNAQGVPMARCFQAQGASASGDATGWKLLHLTRIEEVRTTDSIFATRADYVPTDSGFAHISVQVR